MVENKSTHEMTLKSGEREEVEKDSLDVATSADQINPNEKSHFRCRLTSVWTATCGMAVLLVAMVEQAKQM